jgi:RNA polymerase sigma-70 factor (ECF subfamily)
MMANLATKENKTWFEALYEQHSRALWYYLLKILGDAALADDAFQETFYRMWRVKPKGLHPAQEKAYLYRIGTRIMIDIKRRDKRTSKIFFKNGIEDENDAPAVATLFNGDMKPQFDMLSPRDRSLLWLAYVEEYNHRDIAKIIGIKENTVKVMLFRAKKKLIALLEGEKK